MSNYNIYTIRIAKDYGYCVDIIEVRRRARSYKEAGARARQICNKILKRYEGEAMKVSIISILRRDDMSKLTTAQRESAYYNLVQTYRQQVNDMDFTNYSTRIAGLRSIYNTMELLNDCFVHDRNVTGYAYTELTTMVEQIKDLIDDKLSQIEY